MRILAAAIVALLTGHIFCEDAPSPEKNGAKTEPQKVEATLSLADFENRSPALESDWISIAAPDMLAVQISRISWVAILERSAGDVLKREMQLTGNVAEGEKNISAPAARNGPRGAAAAYIVGGWFESESNALKLSVQISTAQDSKAIWSQAYEGTVDKMTFLFNRVSRDCGTALASAVGKQGFSLPASSVTAAPPPLSILVPFYRGKRAAERGEHARALAEFLRVVHKNPGHGEAWRQAAMMLEALGRPAAAMAAYEQAITSNPDDPSAPEMLWRLGNTAEDLQDLSISIGYYKRLIDEYPFSFTGIARERLAKLYFRRMELSEARRCMADMPSMDGHQKEQLLVLDETAIQLKGLAEAYVPAMRLKDKDAPRHLSDYVNDSGEVVSRHVRYYRPHCRIVPADSEKVFDWIEVEIDTPQGNKGVRPTSVTMYPFGAGRGDRQSVKIDYVDKPGEKFKGRVTVPDICANGFDLELDGTMTPSNRYSWELSATLKKPLPGVLAIETRPVGARIKLDGVLRGISPCRIRNLACGKHHIDAETELDSIDDKTNEWHFSLSNDVVVIEPGETKVQWELHHAPVKKSPTEDWSAPYLAATPRPGDDITIVRAAWHPAKGWVLAYGSDADIFITCSVDGSNWSVPARVRSIPHSSDDAKLQALLIAPNNGRTVLIFNRAQQCFACVSDNLQKWSLPQVISRLESDTRPPIAAATVTTLGEFMFVPDVYEKPAQLAQSNDGFGWSTASFSLPCQPVPEGTLNALPEGRAEYLTAGLNDHNAINSFTSEDGHVWVEGGRIENRNSGLFLRNPYSQNVVVVGPTELQIWNPAKNEWTREATPALTSNGTDWWHFSCSVYSVTFAPQEDRSRNRLLAAVIVNNAIWARLKPAPPAALNKSETGTSGPEVTDKIQRSPVENKSSTPAKASTDTNPIIVTPVKAEPIPGEKHQSRIYLWLALGILLTGVACFFWFKKRARKELDQVQQEGQEE